MKIKVLIAQNIILLGIYAVSLQRETHKLLDIEPQAMDSKAKLDDLELFQELSTPESEETVREEDA